MNTIGSLLKKILDIMAGIVTGQGVTNSQLQFVRDDLDAAKRQAEISKLDTDARLNAADDKLAAILATLQLPEETPTAMKITIEPGDTRNIGGF